MESTFLDRLSVLSHPQRMAIFRLLVRRCPDAVPAGEIARVLGLKASTASVYLSALNQSGLIRQSRRGTSVLYQMNLDAAQSVVSDLFLDCCRGRPDLCPPSFPDTIARSQTMPDKTFNVLFICTGNSARSVFAEAILRHEASDRFTAYSAGTQPRSELNPNAIEMLESRGIDTSALRAKTITEFQGPDAPPLDFVFTVCDLAANEDCPAWTGQPISAHWGLPDPVKAQGTEAEKRLAFQQTYGAMRNRIKAFAALPFSTLDRASLQKHIDDIGRTSETL
ncbi:helix-turn-helix domain-containing protein [Ruegeria sp. 2012CJ41-6]|uniref:Helix-turn-helix domain-containing protein n=1 Tax=Ruegeria spongiae TaxID=2942209 RepID=A0ABT0Q2Z1_9RHOB|nr:helix-turn-helix domain-containing protein [Ruegeria spongiae]MCL6284246.1 helix-turn-helix domain-containing protein [Ruegeria spongiae]